MALFNYATKEITLKIVYYGPGLSGKTTNIQHLHAALNPETKGKLLSLATESDRTLFFDFLPVELGKIKDFSIRFQLYTVPGQVRYNATRKVVLKGADAVVFVADSQQDMRDQNIESLENMRENLISNNINPDEIPVVLQYNKRDLKNILSIIELNDDINNNSAYAVVEAEAINGKGVEDTFQLITRLVLKDIARKHKIEVQPAPLKEELKIEEETIETWKPEVASLLFESEAEGIEARGISRKHKIEVQPAPLKEELKIEEEAVENLKPEVAPLLFESEAEGFEPSVFAIEEEEELIEPEYELEEPLDKVAFEKAEQEPEPEQELRFSTEYEPAEETNREPVRDSKEVSTISDVPSENMNISAGDASTLNAMLLDLKGAVNSLRAEMLEIKESLHSIVDNTASSEDKHASGLRKELETVSSLKADIIEIKDNVNSIRESVASGEDKHITDLRKEHLELHKILKDIIIILRTLKIKKSWFRI